MSYKKLAYKGVRYKMYFHKQIHNQNGMALILALIILSTMMIGVLALSKIATKSYKLSQSRLEFNYNFHNQLGLNLIANYYIWNRQGQLSGLFTSEYLMNRTDFKWQGLSCNFIIKSEGLSINAQKDISAMLYKAESFRPGFQINSGGGKGTQHYEVIPFQTYTTCKTSNERNILTFRNWLEKLIVQN